MGQKEQLNYRSRDQGSASRQCFHYRVQPAPSSHQLLKVGLVQQDDFAETKPQRPDPLQPVFVSRAQLDRTVLQQDQAVSACRDPIRQTRG